MDPKPSKFIDENMSLAEYLRKHGPLQEQVEKNTMTIIRLKRDNVYSYRLIDCYKKKLAEKKAIIEKQEAVIKSQEEQMKELTKKIE